MKAKSTLHFKTPLQRAVFLLLLLGSSLPTFFATIVRPAYLVVGLQLACISGMLFMLWRHASPRLSILPFILALFTGLIALGAGLLAANISV